MNYEEGQADIRRWALAAAQQDFAGQHLPAAEEVLVRAESYLKFLLTGEGPAQTGKGISGGQQAS